MNLIVLLGIATPLVLVCLIFVVVHLAVHKEEEAEEVKPLESVDSGGRQSTD